MIVGVVGVGKARGVTTVATGLGCAFGSVCRNALLVEADSAGGDLAAWRGLSEQREVRGGVLNFASEISASRDAVVALERTENLIDAHAWRHPSSVECAVMPLGVGGAPLAGQIEAMWSDGRGELAAWPGVVVMDFGRWGPSLTSRIWNELDAGVVVCSGDVGGLRRAMLAATAPPMANGFPTVLIVNGSAWALEEIRRSTNLDIEAVLDWDTRCAERIRLGEWKAVRKRLLARQLVQLASALAAASV